MECLLLGARRYSFDAKDGRHVEGVTLTYLIPDSVLEGQDSRGVAPLQVTAPVQVYDELQAVPGFYTLHFSQKPGKDGRPVLTCTGVQHIRDFALFDFPGAEG